MMDMRQIEAIEKAITEEVGQYSGYLLQAYKYTQRNSLEELTFDDLPWGNFINSGIEELVAQMKELGIKEFWVSESSTALKMQLIALMNNGVVITGGEVLSVPSPYLSFNDTITVLKCEIWNVQGR